MPKSINSITISKAKLLVLFEESARQLEHCCHIASGILLGQQALKRNLIVVRFCRRIQLSLGKSLKLEVLSSLLKHL